MRGIRGATTVKENSVAAIEEATVEMLRAISQRNALHVDEIVAAFFTLTPDLTADFPARAARQMGWDVPMLDTQEVPVPEALACCIRVLVLVERSERVRHVYLGGARTLRPDLVEEEG